LSFFDEVDEPPRTETRTTPRTTSRAGPRGRRPSGTGGRRPPGGDQQSIQIRRAIALGALVVIILLIALGVHSCQVSATNSALQDYANSVSSLNSQSAANGKSFFTTLAQATSANATNVQNQINQTLTNEKQVLSKAKALSVPDQVKTAHAKFVQALQMRVDGVGNIAQQIQPALAGSGSETAVNNLAAETAVLYASDVIYKRYAVPELVGALHAAGTRFSPINPDQFVTNVQWVLPSFIAQQLNINVPTSSGSTHVAPGLHGHSLTSVSVAGTTLQTGSTNTVPANPIPTFTLDFNNGGTNNETNVKCKVSINGSSVSGTATVPETFAGKNASCQVKLNAAPPTGTQSVVATIEKVPGEHNVSNNSITYTITFQ
jgi:hypothetical protein